MKNTMWVEGRQGTGYYKLKLWASDWLKADCYILKYPKGARIPFHTDKVDGYCHHRINVILKTAVGGIFIMEDENGERVIPPKRVIKFRPDITPHAVSTVHDGTRYVLSFGWLTK